jgi:hypothetical protein
VPVPRVGLLYPGRPALNLVFVPNKPPPPTSAKLRLSFWVPCRTHQRQVGSTYRLVLKSVRYGHFAVPFTTAPVRQWQFVNCASADRSVPPLKLSNGCRVLIHSTSKVMKSFLSFTVSFNLLHTSRPSDGAWSLVRRHTFVWVYCS